MCMKWHNMMQTDRTLQGKTTDQHQPRQFKFVYGWEKAAGCERNLVPSINRHINTKFQVILAFAVSSQQRNIKCYTILRV